MAIDHCGAEEPFVDKKRFLSASNECDWAGIECMDGNSVTDIEFGEANAAHTYTWT